MDLVDAKTVAEHLGMASRTIYEWTREGKFPARRLGNTYRYDLAEVDRWVESRRVGPKVPARKEA
jgi:excisionase family DNA binding protein